jgi:hypothetical protein
MLEKTITYTDFFGEKQTETFYFHLGKADLTEMSFLTPDGLAGYLRTIIDEENSQEILRFFKEIVAKSIGQRTADGKRFIKNDAITAEFMETNAYEELFMELMTNETYAAEFIKAILPADLVEAAEAEMEHDYSEDELLAMDDDQFAAVAGRLMNMDRSHLVVAMKRRNQRTKDEIHDLALKKGILN